MGSDITLCHRLRQYLVVMEASRNVLPSKPFLAFQLRGPRFASCWVCDDSCDNSDVEMLVVWHHRREPIHLEADVHDVPDSVPPSKRRRFLLPCHNAETLACSSTESESEDPGALGYDNLAADAAAGRAATPPAS